jgi:roadblock/LC7 domain-containing protein
MSYDWAMTNFPWQLLPALASNADASIVPNDNGIHIHVSRDGFDSSAHMFRWLKFWYRNPRDVQRIARRRASDWASFRPDQRAGHAEHVKYGKPNYRRSADTTRGQRYAAINTQNDATLEVRVFASTLRPQRAQAALQLVAGTVEYTRQLTADAITHRHGWDWQAFMAWTAKSGQYAALVTEDRIRRPV